MIKKRRTIYIVILLAGLLSVAAYLSFVYWPFRVEEGPTLVYFYAGG